MNNLSNNTHARVASRDDAVDFRELVNVFLRRHKLFIYIAVPVFLGIIIAQFARPLTPLYRATFDIGITNERPIDAVLTPSLSETPAAQMGTVTQRVIASLLSVSLAEKVADTLGLYAYVKNANSDIMVEARIKKDFAGSIGPLRLRVMDDRFALHQNGEELHGGDLGRFVDLGPFELKVTRIGPVSENKSYEITVYPRERVAVALRNSLAIKVLEADKIEQELGSEDVPFSGEGASKKPLTAKSIFPGMNQVGIVRIDVHWSNREDALRIAKALSEQLIAEDKSEKSQHFRLSKLFIDSLLVFYRDELTEIEEQIRLFKEEKKIADLRASTQALINQVSTLESKKNQLEIEQKILVDLGEYLARSTPGVDEMPNFSSVLISSAVLQNLYQELLNTEADLKSKLKEYSTSHPKVLETQAKLDGLKEQMQVEITKRIPTIKTEIASVNNQIAGLQVKLQGVPDDEISLARLERDKEAKETQYTLLTGSRDEARMQEAAVTSDLKVINPAMLASGVVNRRRPALILFLSVVIAVLAGGFAVFIAEYVDNTVKDPDKVSGESGIPIFASIPVIGENLDEQQKRSVIHIVGSALAGLLPRKNNRNGGLTLVSSDISKPEFEAFRKLSMNLDFAHPDRTFKQIYVTSPGPEEGKTFVALNLALVLAALGKKLILVDTDFRKKTGNLTDVAQRRKAPGLFDVLKAEATLDSTITPFTPNKANGPLPSASSGIKNLESSIKDQGLPTAPCSMPHALCILPVGLIPPNPFIFLESDRMKDLLKGLGAQYDYVIVDGVPILLFADAAYLANFTDGVLLTVRYGKTGMKELQNAKDVLDTAKSTIIGLVMNSVPRTRGSYYYQYYHKYYSKYYKNE